MNVNINLLCIGRFQFEECFIRLPSFVFSFSVGITCDCGTEGGGGGGGGVVVVDDVLAGARIAVDFVVGP